MRKFLGSVTAVVCFGIVTAVVGTVGVVAIAAANPEAHSVPVAADAAATCPAMPPLTVGTIVVPAGPIAGFCQDRLLNAAEIILAARAQGIGTHTQAIGVMTAMGESSLVNIDHGDTAGPDSRGLFQQRDNGAWGSYQDRMTPYIAATNFFTKLVRLPNWKALTPTEAAHAVQVNADPNHYTAYWPAAEQVVAALSRP